MIFHLEISLDFLYVQCSIKEHMQGCNIYRNLNQNTLLNLYLLNNFSLSRFQNKFLMNDPPNNRFLADSQMA
jgi:hypothetical protein